MFEESHIVSLLLLLIVNGCKVEGAHINSCHPAEEFKEYQLNVSYPSLHLDETIEIKDDTETIGCCSTLNMTCKSLVSSQVDISIVEINEQKIITLDIRKVLRKSNAKEWKLYTSSSRAMITEQSGCLWVFSKASGLSCSTKISETGLSVVCSATRIYPQGSCNIHIDNILQNITIVSKNEALAGTQLYFASNCTLFLPNSTPNQGNKYYNITMYPNVTNSLSDFQYGSSIIVHVENDAPKVRLENCSNNILERLHVNCTCTSNKNFTDALIVLYALNGTEIQRSRSLNVTIGADLLNEGFICKATNFHNLNSEPVFYKPDKVSEPITNKILVYIAASGVGLLAIIMFVVCLRKKAMCWTKFSNNGTVTLVHQGNRASYMCEDIYYEPME